MNDARTLVSAALRERSHPNVESFGRFVCGETNPAVPPCWGDIVDAFDEALPTDDSRIEAFEGLRGAGDLGAILLFLDHHRDAPNVLAHVWAVAAELSPAAQCAVVSLNEPPAVPDGCIERLHPAARALLRDEVARARDHEFYAARAAALRSLRTRIAHLLGPEHPARTP